MSLKPHLARRAVPVSVLTYFLIGLRIVVITLMMRDAKSADQNPETSNFSLHRAVSDNIAALTIKRNIPKVIMETGKVSTLIIEPKTVLMRPKRSATQRYVVTPPSTEIPGTIRVAIHIENARTAHRTSNISCAFLASKALQTYVLDRT